MARELEAESGVVNVTYVPLQEGDPIKTTWNGLLFHANKPVPIPLDASFTGPACIKDKKTRNRRQIDEHEYNMVDLAKQNPFFRVEGFDIKQVHAEVLSRFDLPKTSAAYRSWVLTWLQTMTDADDLDSRWAAEEQIRDQCLYDHEDERFLMPMVEARRNFLRGSAA